MKSVRSFERLPLITALATVTATLLTLSNPSMAQLKVLISGGFAGAYRQAVPEFEATTGIRVSTESGASQGTGPQTIAAQLQRGVHADVVILSREGLADLVAAGRIVAGTDVDLGRVPLGVAVRAGALKPDISTVAALKQTLLNAKSIVVPGSTSGIYLTTELFPRLEIADRMAVRVTERGSQATAMVAAGGADIAIQPVSELMNVPGIEVVGRIPNELQLVQTFAGAIVAGSNETDAAKRLIEFLASERASAIIEKNGIDPVPTRATR